MLKSNEMKLDINEKRAELEKFQREERIQEAQNAATELNKMVDALNVQLALEKSDFENFLKEAEPLNSHTDENESTLRKRAFNKLVFKRGRLTEEENRAYNVVTGQIEGVDPKGGYLVPEEQITTLREYRKAYTQLKNYCRVVQANSNKGSYPTLGKPNHGLFNFSEMNNIPKSDLEFGQIEYTINDYGDIIEISNQLIQDANVDIMSIVGDRLARYAVISENQLILSKLNTLTATAITDNKGLDKALIKSLDPIYWSNAKIFTNQDGYLWLKSLVDANQRPLLQPDLAAPNVFLYSGKPVIVVSNDVMPSGTSTIPFYVGNLADYLAFFERKGVEIAVSAEAGFEQYKTLLRCVVRFGATIDDADAMIALTVATS